MKKLRVSAGFCVSFLLLFALISIAGLWASPSDAQTRVSVRLILKDDTKSYAVAPYVYITKDKGGRLTYKDVVTQHLEGHTGQAINNDIITLGSLSTPHWILFSIVNQTDEKNWMLSFGKHLNGRQGVVQDIYVYDHSSRKRLLDTVAGREVNLSSLQGDALKLSLEKNKTALLVINVVPESGMPVTLAPYMISEPEYVHNLKSFLSSTNFMTLFFIVIISFFFAAMIFRKMGGGAIFVIYYALQLALFTYQNNQLYTPFPLAAEIYGGLFAVLLVSILFGTRYFLNIVALGGGVESKVLTVLILVVIGSCGIGAFVVPEMSFMRPVLLFVPTMLSLFVLFLLIMAFARTSSQPLMAYGMAWLLMFCGAVITALSSTGLLQPSFMSVNAYWYSLVPQAFLLMWAMMARARFLEGDENDTDEEILPESDDGSSLALIRQTKELAENARLLKVIEHEREVMNEFRERELTQTEEMREARIAADEASNAKSAFLAVVSHEIRTPMTGIMGMARLLLETQLSKEQYDYAQTLQDSGDAMMALLNDILDFEKIESGKLDLEYIDFDLHRILQGVVTLMFGHAEAKGIYLKLDLDHDVPRVFIGDPVRFRQVFLNLCGNSIKFTDKGGVTIHVKIDTTTGAPVKPNMHKIRFSIEDTGIGISKEARDNLFNPFTQADSSVSRKFGGTGLGLTICQRLIEAMGGKIEIDSTEGRGSAFFFTLLMEEGDEKQVGEAATREKILQQKSEKALKILIVEDNEINQKLIKEFLSRMGHDIEQAITGEEALEFMEKLPFDVVFMDIELPGISGMETTKAIRAMDNHDKAATPVIALSGNVGDEDIRACYAANMNGHLPKPIKPENLKAALDKVIEGHLDHPVELAEKTEGSSGIRQVNISSGSLDEKSEIEKIAIEEAAIEKTAIEQAAIEKTAEDSDTGLQKNDQIFDTSLLKNLRSTVATEQFKELLDGLFDKTDEIIAVLTAITNTDNISEIAEKAHELKGMADNFGLIAMCKVAGEAEKSAKANKTEGLLDLLAKLPQINDQSKEAVQEWMAEKIED